MYQRPSFKMCVPKFRVWMGTKATKGRQKTVIYFLSQRINAKLNNLFEFLETHFVFSIYKYLEMV